MGLLERQAYLKPVRDEVLLTKRQKVEIRDNIIHPALRALEATIGLAITFCARLNHEAGLYNAGGELSSKHATEKHVANATDCRSSAGG